MIKLMTLPFTRNRGGSLSKFILRFRLYRCLLLCLVFLLLFLNFFINKYSTIGPDVNSQDNITTTIIDFKNYDRYFEGKLSEWKESESVKLDLTNFEDPFICAKKIGHSLARKFEPRDVSSWCLRPTLFDKAIPKGLLYTKNPKCASSTVAGVVLRIATNVGKRKFGENIGCLSNFTHVKGYTYGKRDRSFSYLLTTVRKPTSRAMSRVFYTNIGEFGMIPTDEIIIKALQNHTSSQKGVVGRGTGGFQLSYISTSKTKEWFHYSPNRDQNTVQNIDVLVSYVKNVIDSYDFLIVVERLDESLVALQLLLGLDSDDILFSSSKIAGGYVKLIHSCIYVPKSFISNNVAKFLNSSKWAAMNFGDFMLHSAAEKSLDLTIDSIGRRKFEKALKQFLLLKSRVYDICSSRTVFPCSVDGIYQIERSSKNCYHLDGGCGYPCFDQVSANKY